MPRYFANKNTDDKGNHEVHTTGCPHPPAERNRVPLGNHASCGSATAAARIIYGGAVDGCKWCCPACHRS